MEKQKNGELSRMFGYAGKFHVLTVLGCVLSGISTILSMLPFVCIWLVIRDLIQAFAAGDISLATGSAHYAWMAVVFAAASILIYFIALKRRKKSPSAALPRGIFQIEKIVFNSYYA